MDAVIVLMCMVHITSSFLATNEDANHGRCIWYGQCGPGYNPNSHLNCPATNVTKEGPWMKSPRGLQILKQYCPKIYMGDDNTRTCCSVDQLVDLADSFTLPEQLLKRCPSCWENFRNIFCQITCGLNQADFMWPDMHALYFSPAHSPKGIPAVTVLLTRQYTDGFYNSCKGVNLPSANDKAISVFCGRPAKDCNPSNLLNYMGNPGNGRAAFLTKFYIQDKNMTMPDKTVLTPLAGENIPCNASSNSSQTNTACSCQDCPTSCCPGKPQPCRWLQEPSTNTCLFKAPFRRAQLVISRPGNETKIRHPYPPPTVGEVNFTSLFDRDFMHQVLELQANLTIIPASYKGSFFTFGDICLKPATPWNEGCAVESVLQYWQNSAVNLDKVIWDEFGFFLLADYLDHFLSCTQDPYAKMDHTKLNMSCRADYGDVMKPVNVLNGFDGVNFQNATTFVLSFYLNTTDDIQCAKADAWDNAVRNFLQCSCPMPETAIAFLP